MERCLNSKGSSLPEEPGIDLGHHPGKPANNCRIVDNPAFSKIPADKDKGGQSRTVLKREVFDMSHLLIKGGIVPGHGSQGYLYPKTILEKIPPFPSLVKEPLAFAQRHHISRIQKALNLALGAASPRMRQAPNGDFT